MRSSRTILILAVTHVLLVVVTAIGWVWSAWWQSASVGAMSDDLVSQGVLDAQRAAAITQGYSSVGTYLQQGWDGRALAWGYALCVVALVGSLLFAVMALRHRRGEQAKT